MFVVSIFVLLILVIVGLFTWRQADRRADATEIERLLEFQPDRPEYFSADMVEGLPEPAQRFLTFAIREGTPLYTVAYLEMSGQFGLGDKTTPKYIPMFAKQVLAAPEGFVWEMDSTEGSPSISGSDSGTWTRFWLAGLIPVARAGGTQDHRRSAFGRYVAEAIFWTPAAVLPGEGITWDAPSPNVARLTMRKGDLEQSVDITVDPDGRPRKVEMERWTNANKRKKYQLQPFGGYLSNFQEFEGFVLPLHVEAGNHFGTEEYFPFFFADISQITFPR